MTTPQTAFATRASAAGALDKVREQDAKYLHAGPLFKLQQILFLTLGGRNSEPEQSEVGR